MMYFFRVIFLYFFSILLFTKSSFAQDFSNKGTEFFITFPAHVDGTLAAMGIYITSDQAASGQVQVGNGGATINFNITANTVRRIFLGNTAANDAPNGNVYQDQFDGIKAGSAIRVTSNAPVVVYAHIIRSARSGSSLILPTPTWGQEYLVPSYWSTGASGAASGRGVLNVIAKESNTTIEIIPTATSFNGQKPAGVPFSITLNNPGDVYQLQFEKDADISGTIVRSVATGGASCKPIAVFSATTWSAFNCPGSLGGDNLYQQLFPTRSWGRTFVTAPFANRHRDIIRVFTLQPGTTITKTENGITTPLVATNGIAEFETNRPTKIEANLPISVVQYMASQTCDTRNPVGCANNGTCPWPADPEMVILNPIEQTINNITVFSAHQNFVPPGQSNVNQCFLNIIIPTPAAASFRINGILPNGNFQPVPGTQFSYLQENVSTLSIGNPVQRLTADSNFVCIAYGYGNVESYGYNAGTNVRDLFQFLTIRDIYQSRDLPSACQQIPTKLFINLPYPATKIEWKFNGIFPDVVINNPVADSTYQREGKTIYRFPLQGEYLFPSEGTYKIEIIANNPTSDGCEGEQLLFFDVVVHPKPTTNFNFSFTGCVSDSARFTSSGIVSGNGESIATWNWDFGDNTQKIGNPVAHRFLAPGTYQISHRVVTNNGCVSDTIVKPITVNEKPVAAFNLPGPFCANQPVSFTNTSTSATGTIARWYWILGDGSIADRNTGAPFTHTYANVGTYTVKLVVSNNTGCASDTVQQVITVGHVPVPGFNMPNVCLNDPLAQFTNTSTIAAGNINQATWLWNFGNQNPGPGNPNISTQKDGAHRYTVAAVYPVKLVVTSNQGCKDSLTQNFTVNGGQPNAGFDIVNSGSICSNQPVQIRNKSTVNFGSVTRLVIYWNWGVNNADTTMDDAPVLDRLFSKTYPAFSTPAQRNYQVRMRAFSGGICVDEIIKTVTIFAIPDARMQVIPGICLDAASRQLTQGFDAGNNPGQGFYSGPGVNASGLFNPQTAGVGIHTILYRFVSSAGCTDSATGTITVWPRPTANFDFSTNTCMNTPITFTNTSVANANTIRTWNWDFGDGTTEARNNGNPFTRTYGTVQNYQVSLSVTTDSGCNSLPVTKTLAIHPNPVADFDLPTNICLPEGRAAFTNKSTVAGAGNTPLTYQWEFGVPGGTSTQQNPVYFYNGTGPFNVSLRTTSARGCSDTIVKVLSNINPQPLANFSVTPNEVCLGNAIQFADLSNPLNNTITGWNWQFGDGGTSTQQNPSRIYARAGTFQVRMFYTTAIGCNSDTVLRNVVVHPFPVVDAGPDQFILIGGEVTLLATVSGSSDYQYRWTPATGLNNPNILQPVSRTQEDTWYTLTVTGTGSCSAEDSVFVKALNKPEIPNAFSPNGDGINDFWIIKYLDSYPGATVQVFDRYGRAILRTAGYPTPWDGKQNGTPVPAGVYYYIVDPKNGLKPITGSLTIIR
jgi:gliding motility-associated-like protein